MHYTSDGCIPAVVVLRPMATITPETCNARAVRSLRMRTAGTRPTSVLAAWANTQRIRDEYLCRDGRRRKPAVDQLVQLCSGFEADRLVQEAAGYSGGLSRGRRGRGRPAGMQAETLEVGTGLYHLVQDEVFRKRKTVVDVLEDLYAREFENLGLDRMKDLYYRMHEILRPDPLLFIGDEARNRIAKRNRVVTIWEAYDPKKS
jgi:hypothetical protein